MRAMKIKTKMWYHYRTIRILYLQLKTQSILNTDEEVDDLELPYTTCASATVQRFWKKFHHLNKTKHFNYALIQPFHS